jgi:hypothetical protein
MFQFSLTHVSKIYWTPINIQCVSKGTEMHVRLHTQRSSPKLITAYTRLVKTSHTEF